MRVPLTESGEAAVQGTVIDASGWIVLLGGVALTALWLWYLAR